MAATRRLSALERQLGVRLVHRTTRSLALTAEGRALLPHARVLLDERAAALASVQPVAAGASGRLRLTSSVAFGRKMIMPIIVDFMRRNPAVEVDLLMTDELVDIVAQGLDLAVRIDNLADSSLVARRLAANPRHLLASADYLARHGMPATLAELERHRCLTISGRTHWTFRTGTRVQRTRVAGPFSANSIEGLLQACLGGLGIANLSAWFVQDELRSGRLTALVLDDGEPEPLDVWAVYPTSSLLPAKVRLFIDLLATRLRDPV